MQSAPSGGLSWKYGSRGVARRGGLVWGQKWGERLQGGKGQVIRFGLGLHRKAAEAGAGGSRGGINARQTEGRGLGTQ